MDDAATTPLTAGSTAGPVPGPPPSARPAVEVSDDDLATLLAPLDGLDERPVGEHPAAYEEVHGRLRAVLAGDPVVRDAAPEA
ncbi:hypothetical protein [Nocardioides marmoraquaticus]